MALTMPYAAAMPQHIGLFFLAATMAGSGMYPGLLVKLRFSRFLEPMRC